MNMSTLNVCDEIDIFQNKAYQIITDQEIAQSDQEKTNRRLGTIDIFQESLTKLCNEFQSFIDKIADQVYTSSEKRELVFLRNKIETLVAISNRFTNRLKLVKNESNLSFAPNIETLEEFNGDLNEIIGDINFKTKSHSNLCLLLSESSLAEDWDSEEDGRYDDLYNR